MRSIENLTDSELKRVIESNVRISLLSLVDAGLASLDELKENTNILNKLKLKILLRLEFIKLDKKFVSSLLLNNIEALIKGFKKKEKEEDTAKEIIRKALTN